MLTKSLNDVSTINLPSKDYGIRPIHMASSTFEGNECLTLLISKGADVNSTDEGEMSGIKVT